MSKLGKEWNQPHPFLSLSHTKISSTEIYPVFKITEWMGKT